ncbi:hypothetical protein QBC37DRAFT_24952 [Rhypophila decipiens]|uniref:Uncharacterized protein n=1 Tax=Rhypophila decipiens TaxID=261697 RepID=A0AAN6YEL4_9PEZI|nr:hypothetical protein QBC37DRAFT_24952 [Rhypophila decipiens]
MNSSSRSPAPPPLSMPSRTVSSPVHSTPGSADSYRYSNEDYMMASPARGRQGSSNSLDSTTHVKPSHINAHSYCGRHSSQYLFGGHSIGELWRNIKKKE